MVDFKATIDKKREAVADVVNSVVPCASEPRFRLFMGGILIDDPDIEAFEERCVYFHPMRESPGGTIRHLGSRWERVPNKAPQKVLFLLNEPMNREELSNEMDRIKEQVLDVYDTFVGKSS